MPPYDASKHEPIEEIDIEEIASSPTASRPSDAAPCRWLRSDRSHREPLLGLSDARVLDALADGERLRERSVRERGLVVGEVRLAPDLGGVGLAPGVLAVGVRREVERFAGGLDGFRWVWPCEPDARERDEQLDPEKTVAAGDGVQQSGFRFAERLLGDRLRASKWRADRRCASMMLLHVATS